MKSGKKLVFFDFGGVIGEDANDLIMRVKMKNSSKFVEINKEARIHNDFLKIGKMDEFTYWKNTCLNSSIRQELGIQEKSVDEAARWLIDELRRIYVFYDDVIDLAKDLKESGVELGIISNNGIEWFRDFFYKKGLDKIWCRNEFVFVSCDLQVPKPDKKMFDIVFERTEKEFEKKDLFFIDNKPSNIEASKSFGIENSICFDARVNDVKELRKNLESRGIVFKKK